MKSKDGSQESIIKDLAKEFGLDQRVIKNIVYYPIRFAKSKMERASNERPIRIKYFGLFVQKNIRNKDLLFKVRSQILLDNIEDVAVVMGAVLEFPITSAESAKNIITLAQQSKDYDKLEMIWREWSYYSNKV